MKEESHKLVGRPAELLGDLDRASKILELGASVSPMAPRSAGWDVTVVDHALQEELIEKYRPLDVDIDNIEKVDIVWRGGPLHEAVPENRHGTFDVLIASHVIEHLPDPIGFLDSASRLLHPESGLLALAVPDKRWCFDCLKQVSTTGQMLAAHRSRAQRHSSAARFDHPAYIAFDGQRGGWGREPLTELRLGCSLEHAYDEFQAWSDDPKLPYVDCHAWHFTPASFELLILELGSLGLLDWRISWLRPQPGVEFLARLTRGREEFPRPADREARRLQLLQRILIELREQTDWVLKSIPRERSNVQCEADAHEARCEAPEQKISALRTEIAELKQSRSWRVTAPLRALKTLLKGNAVEKPTTPRLDSVSDNLPYNPQEDKVRFRVQIDGPEISMSLNQGRDQIARCVGENGWADYEAPLPSVFTHLCLGAHGAFYDVGANTGFYSLIARSVNPDFNIRAFEPNPPVVEILKNNIEENGGKVTVVEKALGAKCGVDNLFMRDESHGLVETSASLVEEFHGSAVKESLSIEIVTLDRVNDEFSREPVALIKVDVEGAEHLVLQGAVDTIKRDRPIMIVEILPPSNLAALKDFLEEREYTDFTLEPGQYTNSGRNLAFIPNGWNHLFVPTERVEYVEEVLAVVFNSDERA